MNSVSADDPNCLFHLQITSEKVVAAFIERAKQVNHIINSIVHDRFEKAIEDAKAVDKLIQSGSIPLSELKKKKPLLGIPYTSKESTACKGQETVFALLLVLKMRVLMENYFLQE